MKRTKKLLWMAGVSFVFIITAINLTSLFYLKAVGVFNNIDSVSDEKIKQALGQIDKNLKIFSETAHSIIKNNQVHLSLHQLKTKELTEFKNISEEIDKNLKSLARETIPHKNIYKKIQNLRKIISNSAAFFSHPLFSISETKSEAHMIKKLLAIRNNFKLGMDVFDKRSKKVYSQLSLPTHKSFLERAQILSKHMRQLVLSRQQLLDLHENEVAQLVAIWKGIENLNASYSEVQNTAMIVSNLSHESLKSVNSTLSSLGKKSRGMVLASLIILILAVVVSVFISKNKENKEKRVITVYKINHGELESKKVTTPIELSKSPIKINEFSLLELIKNCWSTTIDDALFSSKNIKFSEIFPETASLCYSDEIKMKQLIDTLLNNAIRFTEKGTIALSLEERGKNFIIRIKDTGIAIPPKDLKDIFDGYHRSFVMATGLLDMSIRTPALILVNNMVHMLKGYMNIECDEENGNLFTIILPVRYGEQEQISEQSVKLFPLTV
ncbi:MAG: hypothetical protein HYW47_00585 [Deltaproteobacteria bacterium]|nr:hypothetical protein [Deltaproteobacteria bacterium]